MIVTLNGKDYDVTGTVDVDGMQYGIIKDADDNVIEYQGSSDKLGMFKQDAVQGLGVKDGKLYLITWLLDNPSAEDGADWVDDWDTANAAEAIDVDDYASYLSTIY